MNHLQEESKKLLQLINELETVYGYTPEKQERLIAILQATHPGFEEAQKKLNEYLKDHSLLYMNAQDIESLVKLPGPTPIPSIKTQSKKFSKIPI